MTTARRLLPAPPARIDVVDAYDVRRPRPPARPWVVANFVASLDGAVSVGGRSGGLGGPTDKAAFHALRAAADVILVGAGTMRAERYGPARPSAEARARRRERGRDEVPRIAVVSGRLDLDLGAPFFTEAETRPIVVTHEAADPARRAEVAGVADVLVAGATAVDPADALGALGVLGADVVLAEGGPTLLGGLITADVVDELCLTVAPLVAAGEAGRIAHGHEEAVREMEVAHVLAADEGHLLLRYLARA